jgi:hypothetical protein
MKCLCDVWSKNYQMQLSLLNWPIEGALQHAHFHRW